VIETARLTLRSWREADAAPFAALNADPEVMAHFPKPLSRAERDAMLARLIDRWRGDGIAFAAAERRDDWAFIGMVGLARVRFAAPSLLEGATEIGWRLARAHWGQGYATEAARGWLAHGFDTLGLDEIISFTVPANLASIAVMRRLGMAHDPVRSFDHPALPEGHPLRRHVVYALARADWTAIAAR
jgi:RimJ/RimL family protein N-acetyltransferase